MAGAQAGEQVQQHHGIHAAAEGEADVLMRGDVGGDGLGSEGHGFWGWERGFRQPENGLAMVLATLNFVSGCLYDAFQQLPNRTSLLGIRLLIFDDHRAVVNMVKAHPAADGVQNILRLRGVG